MKRYHQLVALLLISLVLWFVCVKKQKKKVMRQNNIQLQSESLSDTFK
jgi:preprotein translocase subunit YajC